MHSPRWPLRAAHGEGLTTFLTIAQACRFLQVCRNTLRAMIREGRVRALDLRRPGARKPTWRIDLASLADPNPEQELQFYELLARARK